MEQSDKIGNAIGEETDLAGLVAQEISAMDSAIDEVYCWNQNGAV